MNLLEKQTELYHKLMANTGILSHTLNQLSRIVNEQGDILEKMAKNYLEEEEKRIKKSKLN